MFCIDDEEDDEDDESMHMDLIVVSSNARNPLRSNLDSVGILLLGEDSDEVLSRFLIVEFQKFFISLSVRPGSRAAICDHLHQNRCNMV
jgi:hypothetical protein